MRALLKRDGQVLLIELEPMYGETIDDCPRFSGNKILSFLEQAKFSIQEALRQRPGMLLVRATKRTG